MAHRNTDAGEGKGLDGVIRAKIFRAVISAALDVFDRACAAERGASGIPARGSARGRAALVSGPPEGSERRCRNRTRCRAQVRLTETITRIRRHRVFALDAPLTRC